MRTVTVHAGSVPASPAQVSALECRMHGGEQVDGVVLRAGRIWFEDASTTARAITEAANAESDAAEYGYARQDAAYARRAARSLAALAGKVIRYEYDATNRGA